MGCLGGELRRGYIIQVYHRIQFLPDSHYDACEAGAESSVPCWCCWACRWLFCLLPDLCWLALSLRDSSTVMRCWMLSSCTFHSILVSGGKFRTRLKVSLVTILASRPTDTCSGCGLLLT